MFVAPMSAQAFEIPLNNEDLVMRWDNTFRYNLATRAQAQDQAILKAVNNDDGDRNFSNGSLVANRIDVLSEFDVVWKRNFGARFSYAAWNDWAYSSLDNTSTATSNTLVNGLPVAGQLSPYTKRFAKGFSGEWLDAFGFATFDVAGVPVSIKAGQHTVYWGDSLLLGGAIHGVDYAQNSLDLWKGLSTPGAEAKELFRPRGGLTIQAQVTNELSLAGQWFYNWQAVRAPESGSYLDLNDALLFGGQSLISGANPFAAVIPGAPAFLRLWNTNNVAASRYSGSIGDFGVSAALEPAVAGRHDGLLLPQCDGYPAAAPGDAGGCNRSRGNVHGDRRNSAESDDLPRQQERDDRRGPARSTARSARTPRRTATTSTFTASRCRRTSRA